MINWKVYHPKKDIFSVIAYFLPSTGFVRYINSLNGFMIVLIIVLIAYKLYKRTGERIMTEILFAV